MAIHIVLLEPEIPQNTGNIARTCVAAGLSLHLIEPLGFSLNEKQVRRAGLDYWQDLDLTVHKNAEAFFADANGPVYYATTKARCSHSDIQYPANCYIMFGKESAGIPETLLKRNRNTCFRIPMISAARSLNLSNSVAVVAYEILRQHGYSGLQTAGELHNLSWD